MISNIYLKHKFKGFKKIIDTLIILLFINNNRKLNKLKIKSKYRIEKRWEWK